MIKRIKHGKIRITCRITLDQYHPSVLKALGLISVSRDYTIYDTDLAMYYSLFNRRFKSHSKYPRKLLIQKYMNFEAVNSVCLKTHIFIYSFQSSIKLEIMLNAWLKNKRFSKYPLFIYIQKQRCEKPINMYKHMTTNLNRRIWKSDFHYMIQH